MIQAAPIENTIALTQFLRRSNLEESPAWELFEQVVSQKPMPTLHHSILQKRLVGVIDQSGSDYEAFPELRCVLAANSVVPDITILRRDRLPGGNQPVSGAPDWLICFQQRYANEVLSPDQSTTKLIAKIQGCLMEGSRLGWLIDVDERVVMVFQPEQPLLLRRDADVLPVLAEVALTITAAQLFAWLP
jgi:Uma2 family endonuclease